MDAQTRFIGRREEVRLLARSLVDVAAGRPGLLTIAGEPGIGKTRLLDELSRLARGRGFVVARGAPGEFEREIPYAALTQALDPLFTSAGPGLLAALDRADRTELAGVFPSVRTPGAAPSRRLAVERHRLYAAVRSALGRAGQARPVVLLLDDLHWADAASVELLCYLVDRPPAGRVLLALAYRPRQAEPALLSTVERSVAAVQISLGPLAADDAGRLLGSVDGTTRGQLIQAAGGNPLYLLVLARAGTGRLRHIVHREVAALPATAHRVAVVASALGDPVRPAIVAEVAGLAVDRVLTAVDELTAGDLLRPADVAGELRFRHPLVRQIIYAAAPPGQRLAVHRRADAVLAARGVPLVERAHHVLRAAVPGDEPAARLLARAAEHSAARAPASAARWYRAALRLLPHTAQYEDTRLGWTLAYADALANGGRLAQACDTLLAARSSPAADPSVQARLVALVGQGYHLLGRHERAADLLTAARAGLPPGRERESAALTLELAQVAFWRRDFPAMRSEAYRALALARSSAAPQAADRPGCTAALAVDAAAQCAFADFQLGRLDAADRALRQAAAGADALPDEALAGQLGALSHLGHIENVLGRHVDAYRHLDRALALARASGQGHLVPLLRCNLTLSLLHQARLAEAADQARQALDGAAALGNELFRAMALLGGAWAARDLGDPVQAVRLAEQALAVGRTLGAMPTAFAGLYLAEALGDLGEPERATAVLLSTAGGDELTPIEPTVRPRGYELLVRAALEGGQVQSAQEYAERASRCPVHRFPRQRLYAYRAEAAALGAIGRHGDAVTAASAALASAQQAQAPLESARSRLVLGRALAAAGDQAAAATVLARAETELAIIGAGHDRDRAARELRAVGGTAPRPTAIGSRRAARAPLHGPLSAREQQVAELVAAGRTNRQIAAQLHISENTVETHLRRIFTKLAVSSRAAVATVLRT